jgi:hypothetical protein
MSFYNPPAAPANITDMATRTRNLDKEGLMSLRDDIDIEKGLDDIGFTLELRKMLQQPKEC